MTDLIVKTSSNALTFTPAPLPNPSAILAILRRMEAFEKEQEQAKRQRRALKMRRAHQGATA